MPIHDISVPIAPDLIPVYPGDPGLEVSSWTAIERGDAANVSTLRLGAHTGTHVDAPAHFIEGAGGMTTISLDVLVGPARVVEVPASMRAVDTAYVEGLALAGATRVLFKTRNSTLWATARNHFSEDFTYLEPKAARALVARGVRLVGWDYLSVEKFGSEDFATHLALLEAGVVIVEGLDLSAVSAGEYELFCLPLKVWTGHGDGAPARAILRSHA
jgi:arylformamidase